MLSNFLNLGKEGGSFPLEHNVCGVIFGGGFGGIVDIVGLVGRQCKTYSLEFRALCDGNKMHIFYFLLW